MNGATRGIPSTAIPVSNPFLSTSDDAGNFTEKIETFNSAGKKGGVLPFWGAGESNGRCFGQATSQIGLNARYGFNSTTTPRQLPPNSIVGGINIYTGASNVEIDYDADQNNFFFKYLPKF